MKPAPIALFVYNRPTHTRRTVEALLHNPQAPLTDLFVFSDGPKNEDASPAVSEVRKYIGGIQGFNSVSVFESDVNKGLAKSIIAGVTQVLRDRENVIVVEDDLLTSAFFLEFMNQGLSLYEHEEKVISIHGYCYPADEKFPETFFLRGADCWGWATWRRGWALFEPDGNKLLHGLESGSLTEEFDFAGTYPYTQMLRDQIAGKNNSWAIRWYASAFLKERLTLYPGVSLVSNFGFDDSGTHSSKTTNYDVFLAPAKIELKKIPIIENKAARKIISKYFRKIRRITFKRVVDKLARMMKTARS